jgi:hypothetical protein
MIPVKCIWLKPDQIGVRANDELVETVRNGGAGNIVVCRDPNLPPGNYRIPYMHGVLRFDAARRLGVTDVACYIEGTDSFFRDLRAIEDPLEWAEKANEFIVLGYTMDQVIEGSQLPRSVVLDRLTMRRSFIKQLKGAEEHGKIIGRAERAQDDNEARAKFSHEFRRGQTIQALIKSASKTSPQERGKVQCLRPGCKVWIGKPKPIGSNSFGLRFSPGAHFCRKDRAIDIGNYPMVDRDGDPIWVTAGFVVHKMREMTEDHLTATVSYCKRAAEERASITGIDFQRVVTPKWSFLLAEVVRRDEKHKCGCDDGLLRSNTVGPENVVVKFCECSKGKQRAKAADIAAELKEGAKEDGVKLSRAVVTTFVVSLIIGGLTQMPWATADLVRYVLEALGLK